MHKASDQAEMWKKVDLLREDKKKLKAELLSMKDNLSEKLADTPLFISYARTQIDEMLKTLDSSFL